MARPAAPQGAQPARFATTYVAPARLPRSRYYAAHGRPGRGRLRARRPGGRAREGRERVAFDKSRLGEAAAEDHAEVATDTAVEGSSRYDRINEDRGDE